MPNLGLLGITMPNESFYAAAKDGSEVSIDLLAQVIHIEGLRFVFQLSQMEQGLYRHGGIAAFLVQVIIFAEVGYLMAISHHSTVRWCSAGIGRIENHFKPFIFPP